ncbi:MAG: hypothetical protein QOI62_744 [Solirubrobacteraceae bacterium]|nr:hypothetical protein [Solirubrobacteraceae bacterium]
MTVRDRILLLVVVGIAALGGFWFLVISPKRAEVKGLDAKIVSAQQVVDQAQASAQSAQQAKARYATDYATVVRLSKAVPADDDMPSLLYQLQSVSKGSKVDFQSLTLAGGASTAPATTTGTPGAVTAAALPPGAIIGAAGFPTMPFQFTFDGSFFDLAGLLRNVQRFVAVHGDQVNVRGRLLTIDGLSLDPTNFPSVKASISATAYLLPADQGATSGATATAPAATQPATAGTAATPTPAASMTGAQK